LGGKSGEKDEEESIEKVRKVEKSRTKAIGDQKTRRPEVTTLRVEVEGKAAHRESLRCKSEDVGR
jgi:hypothetical protein